MTEAWHSNSAMRDVMAQAMVDWLTCGASPAKMNDIITLALDDIEAIAGRLPSGAAAPTGRYEIFVNGEWRNAGDHVATENEDGSLSFVVPGARSTFTADAWRRVGAAAPAPTTGQAGSCKCGASTAAECTCTDDAFWAAVPVTPTCEPCGRGEHASCAGSCACPDAPCGVYARAKTDAHAVPPAVPGEAQRVRESMLSVVRLKADRDTLLEELAIAKARLEDNDPASALRRLTDVLRDGAASPAPGSAPGLVERVRECTCLGSCKGAAGLAPGWKCALEKPSGTAPRSPAPGSTTSLAVECPTCGARVGKACWRRRSTTPDEEYVHVARLGASK